MIAILTKILSVLMSILAVLSSQQVSPKLGSVTQGSEYHATTTSAFFVNPAITFLSFTNYSTSTVQQTGGTLGQIIQVVAGSAGGTINFYDATTTSVLLRGANFPTSTILIASIPTNIAVGTYTIDASYYKGLIMTIDGTVGTTTITWR